MLREVIKEARNVEEAIDSACRELAVERDQIEFEILTLPKRGFLGLKNTQAKVRVYIELPDPKPVREEKPVPPAAPAVRAEAPKPPHPVQQEERKAPAPPRPAFQMPAREQMPAQGDQGEVRAAADADKPFEEKAPQNVRLNFLPMDETEGKALVAATYMRDVLTQFGLEVGVRVAKTESGVMLRLEGDGLGVIIGRRGETLDALQYLCSLAANRGEGDYMRITIDSGNYREKRERTLERLAQKIAASSVKYARATTLEPMNPYERRIIHATISRIDGVNSSSIGEEPTRRVVITPDNARPQQGRARRPGGPDRGAPPRRPDRRFPPRDGAAPRDAGAFRDGAAPREGGAFRDGAAPRDAGAFRDSAAPREGGAFRDGRRDGVAPRGGPQRDRGGFRERPPAAQPTSTAVDRAYAKELEQTPVVPAPKDAQTQPAAPVRDHAVDEAKDMPLYGKIEL